MSFSEKGCYLRTSYSEESIGENGVYISGVMKGLLKEWIVGDILGLYIGNTASVYGRIGSSRQKIRIRESYKETAEGHCELLQESAKPCDGYYQIIRVGDARTH